MSLQDALNSELDFGALADLARRGWSWWTGELAGLLPAAWRGRLSARPRLFAEALGDGRWRLWRDGRQLTQGLDQADAGRPIGLLLAPAQVFTRVVETPPMPAADVRRMLALDIDRLSPLNPDLIYFDFEVLERAGPDAGQRVLLGVVAREEARAVTEAAVGAGLKPGRLSANPGPGEFAPRFDFLPQVLAGAGGAGARAGGWWWAAVAALMAINLAVLVGRDMADVAHLRALVDAQRPAADAALAVREAAEREAARRRDLLARAARNDPMRMLDALTQALPAGAWVQHLEWNGRTVRLVGFKTAPVDIAAAVRGTGEFTRPRALTTDAAPAAAQGQPFDITADARPAP